MFAEDIPPSFGLDSLIDEAVRRVPPMWPLEATVAVNPFLGAGGRSIGQADRLFGALTGRSLLMPPEWFMKKIEAGEITDEDLEAAVEAIAGPGVLTPAEIRQRLAGAKRDTVRRAPTVLDLAGAAAGLDLSAIMADRVTAWASNYFDEGQALWQVADRGGAWKSWRDFALNDLTPEVLGLERFCSFASALPDEAVAFMEAALDELSISQAVQADYLTQLLFDLGGWAQLGRYRLWRAEQDGHDDAIMTDLLAIRLAWEIFAFQAHRDAITLNWKRACAGRLKPQEQGADAELADILQYALDHSAQRKLNALMALPSAPQPPKARPAIQAAFCIDVRSEVFRRALENVDSAVETIGFAGFFGLGIDHRGFASDAHERRLPVLLTPGLASSETTPDSEEKDRAKRFRLRAVRAWGRFKLAAVSSFSFVESAGPIYVPKLLQGALGIKPKAKAPPRPQLDPTVTLESRTDAAETILRAMSLTDNFARLVLLVGHGARVANNPHASALQCGACGGYSGDVNARLLAGLLNDPCVRSALAQRGICIPENTQFAGALHDTTSDRVTVFDDAPVASHGKLVEVAREMLEEAGRLARRERAPSLSTGRRSGAIAGRGRSWSQTRPEWGLAGCSAFIAAPRSRTVGRDLAGRSFLHSYDWREDEDFRVLELILTAPVVVASWISLQYYGSTVAPDLFGAGNKLLHNVVGGVGVLEGNGGLLRNGLPIQSVNDGVEARHEPVRLSVCVEAPREAILSVLNAHPDVKALFDNRWLHLFAMDDEGQLAWRYRGDGGWERAFGAFTRTEVAA